MKKQLITEAFRMQQLAGINPVNSLNENQGMSIQDAFNKAGVDMEATTFVEVDYGISGDDFKRSSGQEVLDILNNMANESEVEDLDNIWFEFKDEIVPWWDDKYSGREALLTVNFGDDSSFAIIQ
jgi:hypothetical protein